MVLQISHFVQPYKFMMMNEVLKIFASANRKAVQQHALLVIFFVFSVSPSYPFATFANFHDVFSIIQCFHPDDIND